MVTRIEKGHRELDEGRTTLKTSSSSSVLNKFLLNRSCAVCEKRRHPSGRTDETLSQDSVHASSQFVTGTSLEDTASFVRRARMLPGSSSTISQTIA